MRPTVLAVMSRGQGLITRRDAILAGMTGREVDRLVRTGDWMAVHRGVYADAEVAAGAKTPGSRQRLLDRAACLRITVPFVRSHTTAALELGLSVLLPPEPLTHVTRPCVGTHSDYRVKHHLAPYEAAQVIEANGFPVLDRARTAIDIARHDGYPYGLIAVDNARWHGVTLDELDRALAPMRFWPDRRNAVEAIEMSDAGAENPAETLTRTLLYEIGRTDVETQFGVTDGVREAWADLRVGRHLIEFDGLVKYRPVGDGGVATVSPEQVVREEKRREDFLRSFRLGCHAWDGATCGAQVGSSPSCGSSERSRRPTVSGVDPSMTSTASSSKDGSGLHDPGLGSVRQRSAGVTRRSLG
jgi:hypothetical protein